MNSLNPRAYTTLLYREYLEHRGAFMWAAGILLALVLLAGIMVLRADSVMMEDLSASDREELVEKLGHNGHKVEGLEALAAMGWDVAGATDAELSAKMNKLMAFIAAPFHMLFMAIAVFALVGCMHDERKDQSILWWKSMPVSDSVTVLSKWMFVMVLAPLITVVAVWLAQMYALTISMNFVEDGFGGRIWSASGIAGYPFRMVFGYLLYALWSLPVTGWIMLVAAVVPRAPMLWAIGLPMVVILLERILFGTKYLMMAIAQHIVPVSMPFEDAAERVTVGLFADLGFWGGLILGAGFIFAAIIMRGRKNAI